MNKRKTRIISDIVPARRPVRHSVSAAGRSYVSRGYQPARLVDVVYVRRHQPQKTTPVAKKQYTESRDYGTTHQHVYTPAQSQDPWYRSINRLLPLGVAGLVLITGLTVLTMTVVTNKRVVEQVAAESGSTVRSSTQADKDSPPSEDEVSETAVQSYTVDPDLPRLLEIKGLGVHSRIKRMGQLSSGAVAVPTNIYDTGWYERSSKPGQGGAVLLVGHINGPSRPGVFAELKKLAAGDVIGIVRGDGKQFQYKVVSKEQVPAEKVDMKKALIAVTPGKNGLNLMTCAGAAINGGAEYTDRIIVYTEQL